MHALVSRSKGLGAAVAVLALSAGVVLAAFGPNHLNLSLVGSNGFQAGAEATEAPDESGAPTDSHGALVSAAAQMPTPSGFRNHGAFVSCVAHMKDVTLGTIDWSTVTAAACGATKHGNRAND